MQTIEAGFKLFEWQYDVIAERNAVRSVFSGRSTSYQVFVMRLLEEGALPLRHPLPDRGRA